LQSNKKILVIDDEAPIRRVIALKLKNCGYRVRTAGNGEEGLRIIQAEKPHVVITDINMPRMDGKRLCEQTDHLKQDRDFLTIVLTARISMDERRWIEKMHQTQFMEKPFSPSKLLDCIEQYLGNR
jgi:CheY-like chemotaxis protein